MTQDDSDSFLAPVMNALAAFRAVARGGSLGVASGQLGVSQSSLSRHVQKLEAHLGCALFLRQHRRMELTVAGQQLFQVVDQGLGQISRKAQSLRQAGGTQDVTLQSGHGFAHFWLLEYFPRLQRSFPDLQINLSVGPLGVPMQAAPPELDVRLGANPDPDWHSDLLIPETICLAASPEFFARHRPEQQPVADLRALPLLHMDRGEYGIHWFGSFFAAFGVGYEPARDTLYYNSYPHVVQAAVEGQGLCILWRGLNGDLLQSGALIEVPGTALTGSGGYYLTCRAAIKDDPQIARLRRWMINGCARTVRRRSAPES